MENEPNIQHFDDIFKHIGQCNKYFFFSYITVSLCVMSIGWNALSVVFLFPETDFWCQVDELDERCFDLNLTEVECMGLKNDYRPTDEISTSLNEGQCSQYNLTDYKFSSNTSSLKNVSIHTCKNGYEYDTTQYKTSVKQEFDLVCEDGYLVPLVLSLNYIGLLIGALIFGNIADRFGRKKTIMLCMSTYTLLNIIDLSSQWYLMFVTFKLISTVFVSGAYNTTFVMGCELVGPSRRSLAGTFISVQWSIGYMIASLYAYLIPYWRFLMLAMAITDICICIMIFWFVPESPRWLHAISELKTTEKILKQACKFSKDPQSNLNVCHQFCIQNSDDSKQDVTKTQSSSNFKALEILRLKNVRMRFLMISFIWFVNSLVYYGITLSVVYLGENEYVANALAGFVEIPAVILAWISIEHWGRRIILSATLVLAGVACATTSFTSNTMWVAALGMTGKFGITASFSIIYIVAAEIYPTPIRNTAIGLSSMVGSIGGIIAPQIIFIGVIFEQLPYLIFGGLAIAVGIVTLLLPETRGLNLPQTLKEGENLGVNTSNETEEMSQDELESFM